MNTIQLPAIAMKQGPHTIYSLAVDGPTVLEWASVSQAKREGGSLQGYQRPEAQGHINGIIRYLNDPVTPPMLPNAVVLALDSRCSFEATSEIGGCAVGLMTVPVDTDNPAGWVVDGQQRLTALTRCTLKAFTVTAVAFVAETQAQAVEQFVLVNSAKPLPKSLIYELLPGTEGLHSLPPNVLKKRIPAMMVERLNYDEDSPLYATIKTHTQPNGRIKDTGMMKALRASMTDGILYQTRLQTDGQSWPEQIDDMVKPVKAFWGAVKLVWADEWELPPRKSRLLHGGGVAALSLLMDSMGDELPFSELTTEHYVAELNMIVDVCHWTSGAWQFKGGETIPWNRLQNTGAHLNALCEFLGSYYFKAKLRAMRAAK